MSGRCCLPRKIPQQPGGGYSFSGAGFGGRCQLLFLLLALWLIVEVGPVRMAQAGDNDRVFHIGVEDLDYYPHFTLRNGVYSGFGRELLDRFGRDRNIRFVWHPLPIKRLEQEFWSGRLDFRYPDSPRWSEGEKWHLDIHYSSPVTHIVDGVVVPENRSETLVQAIQQGQVPTIGVIAGFSTGGLQEMARAGHVILYENDDLKALVRQLRHGRIQGIYGNVDVVRYLARQDRSGRPLVFKPDLPFYPAEYTLATLKHPGILAEFDQWMLDNSAWIRLLKMEYGILDLEQYGAPAFPREQKDSVDGENIRS